MPKSELKQKNENVSRGNSEDTLLVIYILQILKKYSSPDTPVSSQEVIEYLKNDYSIGDEEASDTLRKKVRRHLDTLHELYEGGCIRKLEGKTRVGHKWYYDAKRDRMPDSTAAVKETLTSAEIDFIIDVISSSKILNAESTVGIVDKLLKKAELSKNEVGRKIRALKREEWAKSINKELVYTKETIESCIYDFRRISFDYEGSTAILATPCEMIFRDGKYLLKAKVDDEYLTFSLEGIRNVKKADDNYDLDDDYYDLDDEPYDKPDSATLESLFLNIPIIKGAIENKSGISFKYMSYTVKDDTVILKGQDKSVLPHSLVFKDEKYYLIGFDEDRDAIEFFRVDLMSCLSVTESRLKLSEWDERIFDSLQRAREVEKHPLMLSGYDIPVTFVVDEAALDRVVDAFGTKNVKFRVMPKQDGESGAASDKKLVRVSVRTTREEAFRWSLANADAVELISPQDIRDRLGRVAEPVYQKYTKTVSDKVRENLDAVYKKHEFKIGYDVDEKTAYETFRILDSMRLTDIVERLEIQDIDSWEGELYLGKFVNTKRVSISGDAFTDLSWMSGFTKLESIDLTGTPVTDVSWLKGMKNLKTVFLSQTPISDLSALSEHEKIDWLDISGTNVSDISFLSNYDRMSLLSIVNCPITDPSPLTRMSRLNTIEISESTLELIGEDNLRARHIGIDILKRKDSPFWWLLS